MGTEGIVALWESRRCKKCEGTGSSEKEMLLPTETRLIIVVNGRTTASLSCFEDDIEVLVLGFLFINGYIDQVSQVESLKTTALEKGFEARVQIHGYDHGTHGFFWGPHGCQFSDAAGSAHPAVDEEPVFTRRQVLELINAMEDIFIQNPRHRAAHWYFMARGNQIKMIKRDIGRNNALCKLIGENLRSRTAMTDSFLLTSGRVTSEIVNGACRAQVKVVISRAGVSTTAVDMAHDSGITIIGYARGREFCVFSHSWRVREE